MAKNKGSGDKKNVWKGIQKRLSTTSKRSQENDQVIKVEESKSSSLISEDEFRDAQNAQESYTSTEEEIDFEKKIAEIKDQGEEEIEAKEEAKEETKKTGRPLSEMAFILPALQNHGYDSDEDSLEDLLEVEDTRDIPESIKPASSEPEEIVDGSKESVKKPEEIMEEPAEIMEKSAEIRDKPATFEPVPAERPNRSEPALGRPISYESKLKDPIILKSTIDMPATLEPTSPVTSNPQPAELLVDLEKESIEQPVILESVESTIAKDSLERNIPVSEPSVDIPVVLETPSESPVTHTKESVEKEIPTSSEGNASAAIEKARGSTESDRPATLELTTVEKSSKEQKNGLASILPGVEESLKNISSTSDLKKSLEEQLPPERSNRSREFEYSIEDPIDLDLFRDNVIAIESIDPKEIPVNNLKPRQQEEADQPIREGMKHLFDNRFMKAKKIFETRSTVDPLYALGLGAMAFIKAIMTFHEFDRESAMNALATAYTIAKAQVDNAGFKKPFKDTVSQYFTSIISSNKTGLPANPPVSSMPNSSGGLSDPSAFMPNGLLRAHVVKAECCLLMGILQMTQESMVGYLKCGLNIRRAYHSYGIVWREYKRMGQEYTKYMDCDTVSAIQFGIGSVHLILSSMPPKILKIFSLLGWKSDKQLGFALLKLCLEGRGIRAPLASLMLLAYYSVLTSFAPQLYTKEIMNPAIECLLDAQGNHPNSCFFLFFAARISRVAKNLPLSIQSFTFASESSKGEWTEVAMKQLADYEIGFNHALQLNWSTAASYFEQLVQDKYWSPAFSQYFAGACYEMMGQRTEAILAFAQVSVIKDQAKKSYIDSYVEKKVAFFQKSGYQDLDFSLPAIEIFLVLNAFEYLEEQPLEICLERVDRTLEMIYEREKTEYTVRLRELVPASAPPDYYDQRCVLLLAKASILNSLGRYDETIAHLNWVLDHRDCISHDTWIVPFTYWESGITSWGLGNYVKSRKLWQLAMACTKYDFEYRMAVRLSLALSKCDDMGIPHIDEKELKGESTNSRKRMPILNISPQVV